MPATKANTLKNIKTIIFDLGGVIIDLDVERTINGFSSLSGFSPEKVKKLYATHPVFHDYEKGLVTDESFREEIRGLFQSKEVDDSHIDDAWNAMLLGIPKSKLELLEKLKERYQVMILSNTNNIHVQQMERNILPKVSDFSSLDHFVHKVYYSHILRMRKPDAEIYQYVLDDQGLRVEETIFLDDNADNVKGAEQVGLKVKYITDSNQIFDLFN